MSRTLTVLLFGALLIPASPAMARERAGGEPPPQSRASAPVPALPTPRILVVPFENARSEPRYQWLSEAAAVLLSDGLRRNGTNAIVRSERVRAFEQLDLPVSASISRATIIKVGQLVGAAEVVVGTYKVEGTSFSVTARSIRLDAGRLQPEVAERGELTDLFAIFERLASRVAQKTPAAAAPASAQPPLDAFENYIKGLLAESPVAQSNFLEAALREQPAFDRARLALWEVRAEQADHVGALETIRGVPDSSPFAFRAKFAAAISLIELKRYDEAQGTLKALLDSAPDQAGTAAVLNNLGVLVLRRGATPQAGSPAYYLTKATDADPDTDYLFNLGYAYASDKNYQGAQYWLREALRRDPADVDAHYVLAVVLQATGSSTESSRERDLSRQLSSRYEELDRRAAENRTAVPPGLERLRMEPDGSRVRTDQTIGISAQREQRELAAFHLEQGRKLFDREQDREALAELRRAVYLSPYEARAHLLIGRIHLRAGRPADAIDAFKISIWSEDQAPAHVFLAEAYLKTGDKTAARAEAQRALVLDPASADAKRVLSEIR
ncbi:MAG TPA: tetratricopeptide repeat protein [Vicinamibacterales bacterium]|nr:tetratricopeptide repeat protein [Vicinamibacterales bacterium]